MQHSRIFAVLAIAAPCVPAPGFHVGMCPWRWTPVPGLVWTPMRLLMLRRPWPVTRGVGPASGAVVADVEGEPVGVVQGEGDVGVGGWRV